MKNKENERAWAEPLVGFSSGADPLYQFYKKDIGEFYLLPVEVFTHAFPEEKVTPDQLTVISWILPHTEATKSEHRKQTKYPTERWARARICGEEVNDKLTDHKNKVERGYNPFFLRDYPYEKTGLPRNSFAQKTHKKFGSEERAPIVYVEKQGLTERKGRIPRGLVP